MLEPRGYPSRIALRIALAPNLSLLRVFFARTRACTPPSQVGHCARYCSVTTPTYGWLAATQRVGGTAAAAFC
jgi:hypothetical protein